MTAAQQTLTGYPDAASLIADTGHPDFPGWELIIVMLVVATIVILISPDASGLMRRRADGSTTTPVERVVKAARARV